MIENLLLPESADLTRQNTEGSISSIIGSQSTSVEVPSGQPPPDWWYEGLVSLAIAKPLALALIYLQVEP